MEANKKLNIDEKMKEKETEEKEKQKQKQLLEST